MSKELYLFANWKMYLDYQESFVLAQELEKKCADLSENIHMTVFPSTLAFAPISAMLNSKTSPASIVTGAQNICWVEKGAYTGEVSAEMYKKVGVSYCLIGHSERRHIFKETNHEVRLKMEAALNAGLIPVLCVGETEKEREENKTEEVVEAQLRAAFHNLSWPKDIPIIIAYEPVWAINTGNACDPKEAERMHGLIYKWTEVLSGGIVPKVLYGGSVRKENAAAYFQERHIDGVLVGQASTKFETWMEIVHAAEMVINS
jgi:triosephosphate isomerase